MTVKDSFPKCYKCLNQDALIFWNQQLSEETLFEFMDVFETKLESISVLGTDHFNLAARLLLDDILLSKANTSEKETELLNFLQFYLAEKCATFLSANGIFTRTHDWLVWSISDTIEYGAVEEFQLERIDTFLHSSQKSIVLQAPQSYIRWMATLFYYSRHFGGLKDLAGSILENEEVRIRNCTLTIGIGYEEEDLLNLICQIIGWSLYNEKNKARVFVLTLKDWIPNLIISNQKTAYIQLATGGAEFTNEKPSDYAKVVIDQYGAFCKAHELLHVFCIYYTDKFKDFEVRPEILLPAVEIYSNSLKGVSRISKIYEKGRIFGTIRGLIQECLKERKPVLAMYILTSYFEKSSNIEDHLFIALNMTKPGVSYITEGVIVKGQEISIFDYRSLVKICNQFLGIKVSIKDDPEFEMEEPRHLGFPEKGNGPEFEKILSKYYNFEMVPNKDFKYLTIIPGDQHPIQALMIKELGFSAPIDSSLEKPKVQSEIKKVLLWCYGTLSSDREAELVSHIFLANKIEVEKVDILNETRDTFFEKYRNEDYDVIWLATHGNYDHMLPHRSTVDILPEVQITIEEMFVNTPNSDKQRLLFLNVCDGATSSANESLYQHGFGAGLANSSLCVISHLWPVETEPALYFGALYAHLLSQNKNFWNAFSTTIQILCISGKDGLFNLSCYEQKEIDALNQNLTEQIKDNIYYWGSGVFYC